MAELPILSARVIWALALIAYLLVVGYVFWYWRTRYPAELERVRREEMRQRFMPRPKGRRRSGRRR